MTWKAKCALSLCPSGVQSELIEFAASRFAHYMRAYATSCAKSGLRTGVPSARDAWHLFETYLQLNETAEGKRYKDWLTARSGVSDARAAMESGATLIIRSAVREYLRTEAPRRSSESLDAELFRDDSGHALTLLDLLPGPSEERDAGAGGECAELVAELAHKAFLSLVFRERVALLARELEQPLSCPAAMEVAGCGKSMLSVALRTALERIAETVHACCRSEDRESLAELAVSVFETVRHQVEEWGRSEMRCAPFYRSSKEPRDSTEPGT